MQMTSLMRSSCNLKNGHLQSTYSMFLFSYFSALPSLFKEFSLRWRKIMNKPFPIWYHPLNILIRGHLTSASYILGFLNLLLKNANDLTLLRLGWQYLLVLTHEVFFWNDFLCWLLVFYLNAHLLLKSWRPLVHEVIFFSPTKQILQIPN